MLPFVQVFQRLERAVRDLAQAAGKEVEVVMEGGDVEMDRAIRETNVPMPERTRSPGE
jgi:two-component system chemotaxis sensor kinase CheA